MYRFHITCYLTLMLFGAIASAQPQANPKKGAPEGPLDALDAKDIPEARLMPYAPPGVVAVLATPADEFRRDPKGPGWVMSGYFHGLAFSPDGTKLAASASWRKDKGRSVHQHWVWDLTKPNDQPKSWDEPERFAGEFRRLAYTAAGELTEWNHGYGWTVGLGERAKLPSEWPRSRWPADGGDPTRVHIDFPAALKARVSGAGGPYEWNAEDGKTHWGDLQVVARGTRVVRVGDYWGPKAVFQGEGSQQRTATYRLAMWDVTADPPKLVGDLMRPWLYSYTLEVSRDGRMLATSDLDQRELKDVRGPMEQIRLYDPATIPMRLLGTGTHKSAGANPGPVVAAGLAPHAYSLAFTPDGQRLYSIADDVKDWNDENEARADSVWVWDCSGRTLRPLKGHILNGPGGDLMFTPDGTRLLRVYRGRRPGGEDSYLPPTIAVTPIVRGLPNFAAEQVITLSFAPTMARNGYLLSEIAVAPDGRHIALAGRNGSVVILRLPTFGPKK